MKTLTLKLSVLILIIGLSFNAFTQTINIDSTFYADTEIYPFSQVDSIYGLSITGHITLNSDTSLVRVILVDENYNEFMVYEAYPLIVTSMDFDIVDVCDETCYLNGIIPSSLIIYVNYASITLQSTTYSTLFIDNAESLSYQTKRQNDTVKVQNMNNNILDRGWNWIAGHTSIVKMTYEEKTNIYGEYYNLQGFEYYTGGVYKYISQYEEELLGTNLIESFDWRERHGANINEYGNVYYGGSTGWITPLVHQGGCRACTAFGTTAMIEAMTNLYFNQQLDISDNLDLSEMDVWCGCNGVCNTGILPLDALIYIQDFGIVNEECYIYSPPCSPANPPCSNPDRKITIDNSKSVYSYNKFDSIKSQLIRYGPLAQWILDGNLNHVMLLIGYKFDPETNVNTWIYKDSYNNFREMYMSSPIVMHRSYAVDQGPDKGIHELISNSYERICRDFDKDGYHNWGVGYRIENCGGDLPQDSDDYNPRIGPFDENYYGTAIAPQIQVQQGNNYISNNGFYYFYGTGNQFSIEFTIVNDGNAQLNLQDPNPIEIFGENQEDYEVTNNPELAISMNGTTSFEITYTKPPPPDFNGYSIAIIHINVNEPDIEDYEFAMVFSTDECPYYTDPEIVNYTQTWDGWSYYFSDIIVQSGVTLTITGNVGITEQASLFIEEGASVYVDGGTLTKLCNNLWKGVDVWGNASESQYEQQYQGLIKLKNNGTIEYADVAIETIRYDYGEHNYTTSGGIVMINDGNLINNRIGVRFYPYVNRHPVTNEIMGNLSYFNNAGFLFTNCIYYYSNPPECQIYLDGVDGIKVEGCTFSNNAQDKPFHAGRGKGIFSFNSGFYVKEYDKYPDPEIIRTFFSHLDYGIYALTDRTTKLITIDSCLFKDNFRGTFLSGISNPKIIYNEFHVRDNDSYFADDDKLVGLYLDEYTTGFQVEENQFYTTIPGNEIETKKCVGTVINNSGTEPNEIYNNTFNNILVGISAQGENRSETGEGLCLKCNDFIDCVNDIFVSPGEYPSGPTIGIAEKQGEENEPGGSDPTLASGNTFSEDNAEANYYNDLNCEYIIYTHHKINPSFKLEPDPVFNIDRQEDDNADYSKENSCPSNLSGGGIIDESIEKNKLSAVSAYEDSLNLFTDGGDTESLNTDVQTSFPDEAMEIRQQLLDESPYLSDTIMKSAINQENVLPNAMVRDILVANPQSAKTPDVLNTLDNRFVPMPDYMMGEIMAGLNNIGAKEQLEHRLALHKTKRKKSLLRLERYYRNDTINPSASIDSLIALWQREPYPQARYKISFLHLNRSDSLNLFNILDSIPINFELSLEEQQVHQQYEDIFDILWTMKADSINPDSTMIQSLLSLSAYSSIPGVYAMNRLIHDSIITYHEPVYLPDLLKSAPVYPENPYKEDHTNIMNIFPNPAGKYFIIEYDLSDYTEDLYITIRDIHSKQLKAVKLSNSHTQKVISTANYPNGTYLIQLYHKKDILETTKIIIYK